MSDISNYVPSYYDGVLEFEELIKVEDEQLNEAYDNLNKVSRNHYVLTCDEEGIKEFEKSLNIVANPITESLQFRRERVINRLTTNPPYTLNFLKKRLDSIIGRNKYSLYVQEGTLYIESEIKNQLWFEEIYVTVNSVKPANIAFINKPTVLELINVGEQIEKLIPIYAKLGSLYLGITPFIKFGNYEVVKLPETKSIENNLLNYLTLQSKEIIHSVLINDTIEITTLIKKEVVDNLLTVEYIVLKESEIESINNIQLLDIDKKVLSNVNLYVPVLEDTIISHKIKIKEGV